MKNIVKYYYMTIYVDKITMYFDTDDNPNHCERQCVRCKKIKNSICFKRCYLSKTSRYVMQYRYTVTCCECLDGMKQYNDKRKNELKHMSIM